jgi:hypothetical protein
MCNPSGENGILKCVPSWSLNKQCQSNALDLVLERYPDFKANISILNYGKDRPHGQTCLQAFVLDHSLMAQKAINQARTNLTRAIKRNFFNPGKNAATRHIAPEPHDLAWGPFQLAKGCLKNEPHNVPVP